MKDNKKLNNMIEEEKEKLEKLEEKKNDIIKKINVCKANIEKYTLMKNNEQLSTLTNALDDKGISFEDILTALAAGDMLSLQDKIENGEKITESSINTESEE